jgi:nitrite reductase/ring-hydroxylating ferredoxin subunit
MSVRLCRLSDLPENEARGFDPYNAGRHTLFAIRSGARVRIYRDRCPHEGSPMAWRTHAYLNAARDRIVCHAHGAQFDLDTGLCTLGPCIGQRLEAVPHRVDEADDVVLLGSVP